MDHPSIAIQIWDKKYRFKDSGGKPVDRTIEDTWHRVAKALASQEGRLLFRSTEFYQALENYEFLPGGRIIAGAGTGRQVTLFNCYVMGTIPDSMDGIFSMLREAALTMQQGGGIGYDFTPIRPSGATVKGVAADASGPLTFMDVWDAMCRTVMSAGERRGAMMATMCCDHPDIEDFIEAKRDSTRFRMFNLSVLITDDFMKAAQAGTDWALVHKEPPRSNNTNCPDADLWVYKTVNARDLWNKIVQATYDVAEPGVIFIDRVNKLNNLGYCETISSTNPCGEQPLPPYGACLLGSINMSRLVQSAFTAQSRLDLGQLDQLVTTAVRMMDNVVDISNFPVPQQAEEAKAKRRIGLGVTGLADALAMCRIMYGTSAAVKQVGEWMEAIALSAYSASIELAKERGPFPLFEADGFLREGSFASALPAGIQNSIREHGIRNALLTSIAPTGTISLYAGNVSSGIEPIFAYDYTRSVTQADGSLVEEEVTDYAVALYRETYPGSTLPSYFTTAQELEPGEHLRMQAAAQRWVDSSISKTINVPEGIPFEEFRNIYEEAYKLGCKGCTTYRPNMVTGSILRAKTDEPEPGGPGNKAAARPRRLEGATYKLKWPNEPHAFYVTFTDQLDDAGYRRPFEVFINSKSVEHFQWTVALTRMISAVFRRGGDVSFVAGELREVFDPKGGAWMDKTYVPSLLAALGNVIAEHMTEIGYGDFREAEIISPENSDEAEIIQTTVFPQSQCRDCGSFTLEMEAGCEICKSCGSSKCG